MLDVDSSSRAPHAQGPEKGRGVLRIPASEVLGVGPQAALPPQHQSSRTYLLARDPNTKVVDSFSRAGSHYAKDREAGEVRSTWWAGWKCSSPITILAHYFEQLNQETKY